MATPSHVGAEDSPREVGKSSRIADPFGAPPVSTPLELPPERPSLDPSRVRPGHLIAFVHYARVVGVEDGGERLHVEDLDTGQKFDINGRSLVEAAHSPDQHASTVKATKTEMAERLVSAFGRPIAVCFTKQTGEERILRGRLDAPEPLLGRSRVEDLDQPPGHRYRLVDHRELKWLVVDGVRYELK